MTAKPPPRRAVRHGDARDEAAGGVAPPLTILGLDMSSTTIGYAVKTPALFFRWGHADLTGDIAARCLQGRNEVARLLDTWRPTLVVIESPVARYAKAVLPQARLSGAVLALFAERRVLWQEVAPTVAKRVLCGDGAANKMQMVAAAAERLGCSGMSGIRRRNGKWALCDGNNEILTEDEADAVALVLCGAAMKVEALS